jgi:hypothetical protein
MSEATDGREVRNSVERESVIRPDRYTVERGFVV